jgi:hypothetical protein
MTRVQLHANFSTKKISKHFLKKCMHIINVSTTIKFGECQPRGVRGVDDTKKVPSMKSMPSIHNSTAGHTLCHPANQYFNDLRDMATCWSKINANITRSKKLGVDGNVLPKGILIPN